MRKKKIHKPTVITISLGALGVLWILARGLSLNPQAIPTPSLHKPGKPLTVSLLNPTKPGEESLSLESLRGKPVILNFWASWCTNCQRESLILEKYWQKNKDHSLKVVGVAVHDRQQDSLKSAREWGKTYILASDLEGKTAINYGVTGVPETFFIDKKGIIRHHHIGPLSDQEMKQHLTEIL